MAVRHTVSLGDALLTPAAGDRRTSMAIRLRGVGVLLAALCLHDSEGLSPRNVEILVSVSAQARVLGIAVVMLGDLNAGPEVVAMSRWCAGGGVSVVAPQGSEFSCTLGQVTMIDCVVVARGMERAICECQLEASVTRGPRLAIRLAFVRAPTQVVVRAPVLSAVTRREKGLRPVVQTHDVWCTWERTFGVEDRLIGPSRRKVVSSTVPSEDEMTTQRRSSFLCIALGCASRCVAAEEGTPSVCKISASGVASAGFVTFRRVRLSYLRKPRAGGETVAPRANRLTGVVALIATHAPCVDRGRAGRLAQANRLLAALRASGE